MAKKAKKLKLKVKETPVEKRFSDGGAHYHELSENPESTKIDGEHQHLFIINGLPAMTSWDGAHSHPVSVAASRTAGENQGHSHIIKIAGIAHTTSPGAAHIHELSSDGTNHSGLHRHKITLEDGTEIQSLLPGDLLQAELRKRVSLEIQSVHVSNLVFPDEQEAIQFIEDRGFIGRDVQKLDDGFKFRQLSRHRFKEESLRIMELSNGVKATVGILDPDKMSDVHHTFDSIKDIDPKQEIMKEEQVAALSRLKDAYGAMVVDMKDKATKFIPILNQFVDLSDEFVKNEPFQMFLTEFIDSFNVLQSEVDRIDTNPYGKSADTEKRLGNFEDSIRAIEPILKGLSDAFYESEDFGNFGRTLKKNHFAFKQMILNLPLIREAGGNGTAIDKAYNNYLDIEVMSPEELDHMPLKDLSSLNIRDIDLEKLRNSDSLNKVLAAILEKFTEDKDGVIVEFGSNDVDESIAIGKQCSKAMDLCYNLDKGIPLPSDSVDKILAKDFLQHLSDRETIMKEAARVLKDGGEFQISTPATDGRKAFLPCYKSLWNEEVFKYLAEQDGEFEILENSTDLTEDGSSATVTCLLKRTRS